MEKSRFLELTGMKEEDFKEGYLDKVNQIEQEGFTFSDYHTENFATQTQLGRGMFYEPNDFDKIKGTDHQVMTFEKNGENRYLIINEEGQIQSQPLSKLRYYDRENRSRNEAVINGISALKESLDKQGIDISEKQLYLLLDHTMIEDAYLHDNENINMDTIADELVSNFEEMVKKVSNLTQTQQSEIDHELFGCGKDRQSSAMGAIERSLMASINFPDREDPTAYNMYWPTRAYAYESAYEMDDIIDAFTTFTAQVTQKALREDRITLRADAASMQLLDGVFKEAYGENKDQSRTTALATEKMIEEIKKLPDKEAEKALDNFTRRAYGLNFQYDGYSNINFNKQDKRKPVIKFLHPSITGTVVKMIKEGKDIVPTRINYDLQKIASMIRSTAKDLGLDQETAKKAQENIISQYVDKQTGGGVSYRRLTDLVSPGFLPLDYQNAYDFIIRMADSKASLKEVADMRLGAEQYHTMGIDNLAPAVRRAYDEKLRNFINSQEVNEESKKLSIHWDGKKFDEMQSCFMEKAKDNFHGFGHDFTTIDEYGRHVVVCRAAEMSPKGITIGNMEYPFPDDVAKKIAEIEKAAKEGYKEGLKEKGVLEDKIDELLETYDVGEINYFLDTFGSVKDTLSSMTEQEVIDLLNSEVSLKIYEEYNHENIWFSIDQKKEDPEKGDEFYATLTSKDIKCYDSGYDFGEAYEITENLVGEITKSVEENPMVAFALLMSNKEPQRISYMMEEFNNISKFMDMSFMDQYPNAQKIAQIYQSKSAYAEHSIHPDWNPCIHVDSFYKTSNFEDLIKATECVSRCTGLPAEQIVQMTQGPRGLYGITNMLNEINKYYKEIEEKYPERIDSIKEAAKFINSSNDTVSKYAGWLLSVSPWQIRQEEVDKMEFFEAHPDDKMTVKDLNKISLDELMANRSPFSFSADEAPSDGTTISETETPSSGAGIEDSSYTQETLTEMEENTEEKTEHSKDSKEQVQQK